MARASDRLSFTRLKIALGVFVRRRDIVRALPFVVVRHTGEVGAPGRTMRGRGRLSLPEAREGPVYSMYRRREAVDCGEYNINQYGQRSDPVEIISPALSSSSLSVSVGAASWFISSSSLSWSSAHGTAWRACMNVWVPVCI